MNELALFAGGGGGILAGHLLGWRTVCAVEIEDYPRRVLLQRQADGLLPRFPIWDDVCTFDGRPWQGKVHVISGGFPCTDISAAGKGAGIDGQDSGLWAEMARIICEVQPRYVFVENSSMLTARGLGRVLGDLASMGFDAKWGVLGASEVGAKHRRDRIWIVGNSNNQPGLQASSQTNTQRGQWDAWKDIGWEYWRRTPAPDWQISETVSDGVLDGLANRVDRLKAIGNGQVPLCAATAWRILK